MISVFDRLKMEKRVEISREDTSRHVVKGMV